MKSPAAAWRGALLLAAVATWLACFAVLAEKGTWAPFAAAGPALAGLTLLFDASARTLLRPSPGRIGIGLVAGAVMVGLTHAAFAALKTLWPGALAATIELYDLLNVSGFSTAARAGIILVVAASEEVVFRGALAGPAGDPEGDRFLDSLSRRDLLRISALAAAYAFATLTLGSLLLVGCAFACGVVWGVLRLATRSLSAPIAMHVAWDLGVLIVWPLA